ncbi:hypothetical protein [Falsirhodobacter sp. alg1]|uniref:hypothetical protein n=1 Tax=Falsirhodobacter sp. alg1 TaxID=1472418 RepID=UPI00128F423F|nr:hypothetical protein [Falsirhodobacter sp. alg1]
MKRALTLGALSLLLAAPASAYRAYQGYDVEGNAQRFTVEYQPGAAASNYWCAAGDFAIGHLNVSRTTLIYRISPQPLGRTEGMQFSLSPEGAALKTGVAVLNDKGYLSAGFAESLCEPPFSSR